MKKAVLPLEDRSFVAERRVTIAQQAYLFLRREIIDGKLLPRAPLSEQELSARMGVSRTPIREAMIKLADEGLVDIYPQFGTFVAPIKLAEVFDSQFVRESLECAGIERAIERMDNAQAATLKAMIDTQRRHHRAGDATAFFDADERMHAYLMEIAGHASVWHTVENAKAQMDRVRHLILRNPIKISTVIDEHSAVIDRVVQRDAAGAIAALKVHLRGLFRSVELLTNENRSYFAEEGEGPPRRASRAKK
jgi:GntR family transcriptional regulator, rspAB operon transcriptional repressor